MAPVDGLVLAGLWAHGAAGNALDAAIGPVAAITGPLQDLDAAIDAVVDVTTAESVYQIVQGNLDRAAATFDAVATGQVAPPALDVALTPRRSRAVTHRLGIALEPAEADPTQVSKAPGVLAALAPAVDRFVRDVLPDAARVVGAVGLGRTAQAGQPRRPRRRRPRCGAPRRRRRRHVGTRAPHPPGRSSAHRRHRRPPCRRRRPHRHDGRGRRGVDGGVRRAGRRRCAGSSPTPGRSAPPISTSTSRTWPWPPTAPIPTTPLPMRSSAGSWPRTSSSPPCSTRRPVAPARTARRWTSSPGCRCAARCAR